MKKKYIIASLFVLFSALEGVSASLPSQDVVLIDDQRQSEIILTEGKKRLSLSRTDQLPEHMGKQGDRYMEGYIQALIDANYYEYNVLVAVKENVVYVYNLPKNDLISNSILSFVKDMPGVAQVELGEKFPDVKLEHVEEYVGKSRVKGIWFPQSTLVYQPMVADPMNPGNSVAFRWGDSTLGNKTVSISLGDTFPIFRWREVFSPKGDLQLDIVGCAWSVFNMWSGDNFRNEVSELVNTDYLLALPISYAFDRWSFRFQIYHISSHLGDEFLAKRPNYVRDNPSMEAIDFFTAYQIAEGFRVYGGLGWVFHSDQTYPLKPFYVEYGGEVRLLGVRSYYYMLYGSPFFAVFMRNWQAVDWRLDATIDLGYEWSKLQGVGRKVRIFAEYHNGYSSGEFYKDTSQYIAIRLYYGY